MRVVQTIAVIGAVLLGGLTQHVSAQQPSQTEPDSTVHESYDVAPPTQPTKEHAPQSNSPVELAAPAAPPQQDSPVSSFPSPVIAQDDVLVSSFRFTHLRGFDYIELFNTSSKAVRVHDVSVRLLYNDTATEYQCDIALDGYVLPQKYISFAQQPSGDIYPMNGCQLPTEMVFNREIQVLRGDVVVESVRILESDMTTQDQTKAWERRGWTSAYRDGVLASDFKSATRPDVVYTSSLYMPPTDIPLQIVEILPNPQLCSPQNNSATCSNYIKSDKSLEQQRISGRISPAEWSSR